MKDDPLWLKNVGPSSTLFSILRPADLQKLKLNELVEKYNVRLQKRAIPLLGFVGGIWSSNLLDTVFNENGDIAQREAAQNAMLESLNKRTNYTTEAIVVYA